MSLEKNKIDNRLKNIGRIFNKEFSTFSIIHLVGMVLSLAIFVMGLMVVPMVVNYYIGFAVLHILLLYIAAQASDSKYVEVYSGDIQATGYIHTLLGICLALIIGFKNVWNSLDQGNFEITHLLSVILPLGAGVITSMLGIYFSRTLARNQYVNRIKSGHIIIDPQTLDEAERERLRLLTECNKLLGEQNFIQKSITGEAIKFQTDFASSLQTCNSNMRHFADSSGTLKDKLTESASQVKQLPKKTKTMAEHFDKLADSSENVTTFSRKLEEICGLLDKLVNKEKNHVQLTDLHIELLEKQNKTMDKLANTVNGFLQALGTNIEANNNNLAQLTQSTARLKELIAETVENTKPLPSNSKTVTVNFNKLADSSENVKTFVENLAKISSTLDELAKSENKHLEVSRDNQALLESQKKKLDDIVERANAFLTDFNNSVKTCNVIIGEFVQSSQTLKNSMTESADAVKTLPGDSKQLSENVQKLADSSDKVKTFTDDLNKICIIMGHFLKTEKERLKLVKDNIPIIMEHKELQEQLATNTDDFLKRFGEKIKSLEGQLDEFSQSSKKLKDHIAQSAKAVESVPQDSKNLAANLNKLAESSSGLTTYAADLDKIYLILARFMQTDLFDKN